MLKALERNLGNVSRACSEINMNRRLHYNWMESDPTYSSRVSEMRSLIVDFAESKLIELIDNKNPQAILFLLRSLGKDRGYGEKVKFSKDEVINVVVDDEPVPKWFIGHG